MERLVAEFKNRNLTVSTIKNAHHGFDVDQPGKDSFRHRQAGAQEVLIASEKRWVLMHENADELQPSLTDLIKKLSKVDLILVEGFKQQRHAKIEVVRQTHASCSSQLASTLQPACLLCVSARACTAFVAGHSF